MSTSSSDNIIIETGVGTTGADLIATIVLESKFSGTPVVTITPYSNSIININSVYVSGDSWYFSVVSSSPSVAFSYRVMQVNTQIIDEIITQNYQNIITQSGQNLIMQ